MQTEMSSSPTGGLCLPSGKHKSILTDFQTKVNKKIGQKQTFFGHPFYILNSPQLSFILNHFYGRQATKFARAYARKSVELLPQFAHLNIL